MTFIPKETRTRAEIYAAVARVLTPLLRAKAFPTHQPTSSKENGFGPSLDSIVLNDNGGSPASSNGKEMLTVNMEIEDNNADADREELPLFQLWLTDEKGMTRTMIDTDDSIHLLGSCVRLLMDWSDRELETYNLSYLEDLPEVFKSGFMLKKTRQEAVTLFSCLETFLKEEPLGPDDMWLVLPLPLISFFS